MVANGSPGTTVAPLARKKKILLLLLVGSAIGYLRARQRRVNGAPAHSEDDATLGHAPAGVALDHAAPAMSSLGDSDGLAGQIAGIADVDPVPLTGMGEGIDVDANAAAHRDIRDQREKLP